MFKTMFDKNVIIFYYIGWDLNSQRPHNAHKKLWDFGELRKAGICMPNLLSESKRPPRSEIPPRKCEVCSKECISECICGESYCSRICQIKEWENHKEICNTVRENNIISINFTEVYWKTRGTS